MYVVINKSYIYYLQEPKHPRLIAGGVQRSWEGERSEVPEGSIYNS